LWLTPQKSITNKTYHMQELIERVSAEAGVTPEQAKKSIEAVANFVKEKFPMMAGAVDQLFGAGDND
jgi:hypothetical protein